MINELLDQLKFFGGTSITILGTITSWVGHANLIVSFIASIVAIIVGCVTALSIHKRIEIQKLDAELKRLKIEKEKSKIEMPDDSFTL